MTVQFAFIIDIMMAVANFVVLLGCNTLLQTTVLIGGGIAVASFCGRYGAACQSVILRTALVSALLCPVIALFISAAGLNVPTYRLNVDAVVPAVANHGNDAQFPVPELDKAKETAGPPVKNALPPEETATSHSPLTDTLTAAQSNGDQNPVHAFTVKFIVFSTLALVWGVMTSVLFLRLIQSMRRIKEIRCTAQKVPEWIRNIAAEISRVLGVSLPDIRDSVYIKSPFLTGFFNPVILLPKDYPYDRDSLVSLFVHELTHHRRNDPHWNFTHQCAGIAFPFQPLYRLLGQKITETSEYVCDDHVTHYGSDKRKYAENLFSYAKIFAAPAPELKAVSEFATPVSPLRRRIVRILDSRGVRTLRADMYFVLVSSAVALFSTFCAGLVGFEGADVKPESIAFESISSAAEYVKLPGILDAPPSFARLVQAEKTTARPSDEPAKMVIDYPERKSLHVYEDLQGDFERQNVNLQNISYYDTIRTRSTVFRRPVSTMPVLERQIRTAFGVPDLVLNVNVPDVEDAFAEIGDFGLQALNAAPAASGPEAAAMRQLIIEIPTVTEKSDQAESETLDMTAYYQSLKKDKLNPVWSPDSEKIAFNDTDYGVWVVNADGGEPLLVYNNYYKLYYHGLNLHYGEIETIGFSPDGSEIAYRRYGIDIEQGTKIKINELGIPFDYYIENPLPIIESVNLETMAYRTLAENALTGCWSPDGTAFAYISTNLEDERKLWMLDFESGERREIAAEEPSKVLFDPEGSSLLVAVKGQGNDRKIAVVDIEDGSETETLLSGAVSLLDISKDGRWLLYSEANSPDPRSSSEHNTLYKLALFDMQSGILQNVQTNEKVSNAWGRFSPDDGTLCLNLMDNGFWNIYFQEFESPAVEENEPVGNAPAVFSLGANSPNPFNMATSIEFTVAKESHVSLMIYNSLGQKVRTLVSDYLPAGVHHRVWDGLADDGNTVSAGIYISRLSAAGRVATMKMTVIK